METASRYSPQGVEEKWYQYWEEKKYFRSVPDNREPFTIVIPPPNITGILHMGHMLNNTIQDILIRRARLQGKNACWVPGTDHASIATEAKVVRMLRERGIKKSDLTREEFLRHAFDWKEKYGGIILQQLRRLGASCDWDRTAFTMDDVRSQSVIQCFVDLYKKGKLYRGKRMIHWDPEAKTVLSNEEVIYKEENAQLFHIRYVLESDPSQYIVIATQRPETIMADSAVAVHPEDERYKNFVGKKVLIPLINRAIPVIVDEYVDREFGTGALKVTPAHDQNDYELGIKHKLEVIDILNEDGSLNSEAKILIGLDRFVARKKIKSLLDEAGVLVQVKDYMTNIGRSERTSSVVEPRLSLQWYVDSGKLAEPALHAVMNSTIEFLPDHMKNTYRHWMENIRDWCISRQLWWGHQVPAYYYDDEVFVCTTRAEALEEAKKKIGSSFIESKLKQDEDVLDTWFSSWLWPISVFDGFNNTEDFKYYYPTNVLVTGWDIIFLWVARMIMAGYEWIGEKPFQKVYFTGMVRDKQGRKMSKQLGNSPDALQLIDEFGADGVRFGMLSSSPAGGDLLFDDSLCGQGWNFCNKIYNATRLVKMWSDSNEPSSLSDQLVMRWMENKISQVYIDSDLLIEQSRLSEALKMIYSFIFDEFCGFYLEAIKPKENNQVSKEVLENTISYLSQICTILHPFMPFITEEIWHNIKIREKGEDCMMSSYPKKDAIDVALLEQVQELRQVLSTSYKLRQQYNVKMNLEVPIFIQESNIPNLSATTGASELLLKLGKFSSISNSAIEVPDAKSFLGLRHKYYIQLPITLDKDTELQKLEEEIKYQKGFIESVMKKLSNERFVSSAPADLVEKEKRKLEDGQSRLQSLIESFNVLKGS
ncbi:MAG: valine--tRNA ligase [Saprospiraceae bacterium]|nr:valine--tRNA ligase [Saprospiraceae bacterium]